MPRLVISLGLALLTGAAAVFALQRTGPGDFSRTPVLFVHGHGLSSRTWEPLVHYLRRQGYPAAYLHTIDLVPNNGSNIAAAEKQIAPAVEELLEKSRAAALAGDERGSRPRKVALVGHSMGAVSARWYTARLRPERVDMLITLAGANHGTNALCPYSDDGAREMCPAYARDGTAGRVQVPLNGTLEERGDETPYGLGPDRPGIRSMPADNSRRVLYFSVRIEPDAWITPSASALLDGAGGVPVGLPHGVRLRETSPGNYLFQEAVDHDSLLAHPGLHELVSRFLSLEKP